jgi:hypothetical protein
MPHGRSALYASDASARLYLLLKNEIDARSSAENTVSPFNLYKGSRILLVVEVRSFQTWVERSGGGVSKRRGLKIG